MADIIIDTFLDGLKLLPFLFATYFVMEYIEHRMGQKAKHMIEKSGHLGPVLGGAMGVFPQCGFSAAASGLYAARMITLGTLLAVFLSTSDEMLPILISEQVSASVIFKLLGIKALAGIIAGTIVDLLVGRRQRDKTGIALTKDEAEWKGKRDKTGIALTKGETEDEGNRNCGCENCEDGMLKSALCHTGNIFLFLLLVTFVLNTAIHFIGEEFLTGLILNRPLFGHMIGALVGLIPNCASSVIITQLYLKGAMGLGAAMSGLLAGSGVGLAVLFRVNGNIRENIKITSLLYIIGIIGGIAVDMLGITV